MEKSAVKTLSFLIATIGIYLLLWQALHTRFALPDYYYARLIELLGIGLFIALALHTPMKFEKMGIITDKKTLFRSLSMGGIAALAITAFSAAVGLYRQSAPLFSWHIAGDISRMTYFLVAPLQEILAKSVMYYDFEQCFGKENPHIVILMCAVAFGIFHVAYGLRMMLLAMVLTLLTSLMFRRARCVWGCALAHFACGFIPVCFGIS